MNKWQIICPVTALLLVGLGFGIQEKRRARNVLISVTAHSIGRELIATTNSTHLFRIGPGLQMKLSEFLGVRTRVADVLSGDEPPPFGDGAATMRLVLTNELAKGLVIRLRPAEKPDMFHVLGFRSVSE